MPTLAEPARSHDPAVALFQSERLGCAPAQLLPPLPIAPAPVGVTSTNLPANPTQRPAPMNSHQRPAIYLGDHVALTRTAFDHKIYVDTRDISLAPHILLDGYWEMWITKIFMRLVQPGMTVIDIGANIGYYSLIAGSHVGPGGKVISFEANPSVFRLLANSMEINGFLGRAELVNQGVMDKQGELTFYSLASHHGSSSFFIDPATVSQFRDTMEEIKVTCLSLDEYFADRDPRVDVIKIDAEGAEPAIIAGAQGLLTKNHDVKILMEYTPVNRSAVDALLSLGFKMWNMEYDTTLAPVAVEELDKRPDLSMLYFSRE